MTTGVESEHELPPGGVQRFVTAFFVLVAMAAGASFFGKQGRDLAICGAMVLPFAALAGLSYAGESRRGARAAAMVITWLMVVLCAGVFMGQVDELLRARHGDELTALAEARSARVALVMLAGMAASTALWFVSVRRAVARFVPIDPNRFTHAVALVLTVSFTVSALAPLLVLGEPVLTALVAQKGVAEADLSRSVYAELYPLCWLIPVSVLTVGYGLRRDLGQCLRRLGLSRPTLRQTLAAVALAAVMVMGVAFLGYVIEQIWTAMGWPQTDKDSFEQLMGNLISPAGAVVVAVSAGLGEELIVRGVLQPRMGIVASNFLFTALHAGQYNWDMLLVILVIGMTLGLVRRAYSTTMSALIHGVYDLFIVLLSL